MKNTVITQPQTEVEELVQDEVLLQDEYYSGISDSIEHRMKSNKRNKKQGAMKGKRKQWR